MGVALGIFAGFVTLAVPPASQAFFFPATTRLSHQTTPGPIGIGQSSLAEREPEPAIGRAAHPRGRIQCPAGAAVDGGSSGRRARVAMSAGEGGDAAAGEHPAVGGDLPRSQEEEGSAVPAGKPVEPVGAAGAMEDDILMEVVGQDYGMMALLRNDKFKGLIVLLRNIPPDEWVSEVARAYPGDDEIKGMMGQVGKLMRMISYYEANNLKRKR